MEDFIALEPWGYVDHMTSLLHRILWLGSASEAVNLFPKSGGGKLFERRQNVKAGQDYTSSQ